MRKLPKIWTALFLAWLSKICVASSPKILSNDTAPIKAIGSDWIIECVGERPVTWSYTTLHDRIPPINETTEYNPSNDYPHSAILNVSDITFRDVQSYKCHFEDEIDDENWSSPNCTFGNVTCAHLFVDDPTNLIVSVKEKDEYLWTMSSIIGSPLIIPCMPTSPFVNISISKNDGEGTVPNAVYSEMEGFTINPGYARDHGYYICTAKRGHASIQQHIYVLMNENIHENPKIDASLANAVKAGENFTLNCTLETATKTKFRLEWISPNSVLNTSRAKISNGTIKIPGGKWSAVTLQNATKEDDLTYVCLLRMDAWKRKTVNHTVEVYDDGDEFLTVSTLKHDIYVNASSNAKWAIEMYGFPRVVTREWRDRNNTLIENKRFRLEDKPKERSVILNIDNVEVNDAGTYYFFVENQPGKSTTLKLNLTVRGVPSVTLTSLYSEGDFYNVDENVTFECVAKSYPNPDIEWSFSGCPEVSSTSLDTYNCPHLNILESTFANFDNDWGRGAVATVVARFKTSGNITCDAINGLTDNYTTSHSQVKLIDFVDSSQTGFTIEGTDKPIERHKTILMCVVAKASFTNKLEWIAMLDDSEETTSRLAVNATTNIEGIFLTTKLTETEWSYRNHLVIEEVSLKHNGTYTCTAENLSGNTEMRNVSLLVQKRVAPKLITNLNNSKIVVTAGDFVPKLNCSASGTPYPIITWFLDDAPFSNWPQNFKKLLHPSTDPLGGSYLQIPSQLEYNGNYSCSATNSADTVAKYMIVEITDGSGTRYWIGVVVILSIVVFFLLMCLGYKSYKDRKYQIDLLRRRRDEFEKGDIQNINPELPVSDQVNLLPYYDTWEFPKEKLAFDKQLGSGAFGRVVKAIAEGIVPSEPLTTVAVKMVKPNSDDSHLNALVSELKIMVHLGKHINVVNLLGACTKDLAKKKELFVIVEYCRYGSILSYLHRHKNEFVDQINPDGNLDPSILYPDMHIQSPPRLNYAAVTFTDSETTRIAPNGYRFLEEITSPLGEPEGHGSVSYNPSDDYALNSNVQSVCTDMSFVSNSVMGTDGRRRSSSGSTSHGHYRGDYQCIDVRPITTTDLLVWSFQIARGMEYLSSRKVLHGDLAARNVLLSDNNVVKICDFGLAKEMYQERYNKKSEGVLLPVKWMAIESICFGVFSSLSDVWSYGVVLWELFTLGKTPYPGMEADQKFYNMLTDGYRMEKPALAPSSIYDLMSDCWDYDPAKRPNFTSIAEHLGDLMDDSLKAHYVDLNDHYSHENRVNMEGREDYLLQMGGGDIVFKEPSPEPDRTYTNVVPEQSDSNYLQPNTSTAYENLDGGPVVQPLANNAGYIFMNHGQNEPKPDDIFSPRPVEVTLDHDSSFNFGEPISLHSTDNKLHVDADCTNDKTPGQGVGSNSNSRSPLEEIQGVSNINYVPNTICLPYTSNDFPDNQRRSADANCNHKNLDEYSSNKKRIKNDSGVSSLGSANDYKIPTNSVPNGDLNGHAPSAKDNLIYFQTDHLIINGHDAGDESYNLVQS